MGLLKSLRLSRILQRGGPPISQRPANADIGPGPELSWPHEGNPPDGEPIPSQAAQVTEPPSQFERVDANGLYADDIVIAVMGPTGAGKSTFICSASGHNTGGVGDSLKSHTSEVSAIKFWDQASRRHIVLVDTPGFDDTYKSDLDILNMISKWLVTSYNNKKLLSGILYLHRITDNRMAGTPLKNLRVFRNLCGKDALDQVYLTTTMWDEVEPSIGEKRLEELKMEYWKTMIGRGAQIACCRYDDDSVKKLIRKIILSEISNTHDIAPREGIPTPQEPSAVPDTAQQPQGYQSLRGESSGKVLLIQEEMVELKKALKETAAGQQLYSQLEVLVEKQTEILHRISREKKATSDADVLKDLQTEYNELRSQIDEKLLQMHELKLPRLKRFISRWMSTGN